jgi:hypothetical protein
MWWHTDLPAVPAGFPAQTEAPPGAVPGEELLLLIDMRANDLVSVLYSLVEGPSESMGDDPPARR